MHVADERLDSKSMVLGAVTTDLLHRDASVRRVHIESRLFFQKTDPDHISAGAHVQHLVMGLDVDGGDEPVAQPVQQAETGKKVGAVVIARDVGEHGIDFITVVHGVPLFWYRCGCLKSCIINLLYANPHVRNLI